MTFKIVTSSVVVILAVLILLGISEAYEEHWQKHISKLGMKFQSDQEHQHRKNLFKITHDKIEAHNKKAGSHSKLAHNKFSTMTKKEKSKFLGYTPELKTVHHHYSNGSGHDATHVSLQLLRDLPDTVDLRTDQCMSRIKDQNPCGSCWTFAATAALEFNSCVKTGSLVTLSEQQIVDCIGKQDVCVVGGNVVEAWNYIVGIGGQDTNSYYPYTANAGSCKFSSANVGATVSAKDAVIRIAPGDVNTAMAYLAKRTVLASAITNVEFEFEHYQKGTVYTTPCNGRNGHAFAIVGYGTSTDGIDYWLIRNSWDTWWGDSGYAMVQRGVNLCGIEDVMMTTAASTGDVVQPVVWSSGPGGYYSYSTCGYAGTITQTSTSSPDTLDSCGNRCVGTSTCNYFSFTGNACTLLTFSQLTVKPTAFVDSSQMCGFVAKRYTVAWTTEGQLQYAANCDFQESGRYSNAKIAGASFASCKMYCLTTYPSYCNHFTLSSTGTCTLKLSQIGSKPTPIYSSTNTNCGWVPTRL